MQASYISHFRLACQQITGTSFKTVQELVKWMGAMQAQDYSMVKRAVGMRLPGFTDTDVEKAIARGEVIRTHALRPTWHLIAAEDIYWILELTAPHIRTSMRSRHKELEITDKLLVKSNSIIEKALAEGKHRTREEIATRLKEAGIATRENNRLSHLLLCAELEGIICSGKPKGSKQTYALLAERVPEKRTLAREEALVTLALRYFTSHGPATLQDFIWWSGLTVTDARHALEAVKSDLVSEIAEDNTYWMAQVSSPPLEQKRSVHLLPAFDEFIISYKDRSTVLRAEHHKASISSNGIFRPAILVNGQVAGIWKRTLKKDRVTVEAILFQAPDHAVRNLIRKATAAYGDFLQKPAEIFFK